MPTNKRYTNATFTKRVDHEAGAHKLPRADSEPEVCEVCGIIYADRRWSLPDPDRVSAKHQEFRAAKMVICPGCKAERDGIPSGYVHLKGEFLTQHREDIENLLRNEAARAAEDNPIARIMGFEKDAKEWTVKTTTEHLAQRLGHALEKAYDGEVKYDFSHENKLAHVWWQRN